MAPIPPTVLEVLQSTTAYFQKREIESPRLNAEHLLAHVLGRKRIELYLEFERGLTEPELAPLRDLVKKRGQCEPLQHLLGTVEFGGRVFKTDRRALIPRPETEQLVEIIAQSRIQNSKSRIADIGTGTGVIALTLAANLPEVEVQAIDVSPEALALAQENAQQLGLAHRVRFIESNLLANVEGAFDLIVANLPYIAASELAGLSREVRHDPEIALVAGPTGLELMSELIACATRYFHPGGTLALEFGIGQSAALTALLAENNYHAICAADDYAGVTRFLFATYG